MMGAMQQMMLGVGAAGGGGGGSVPSFANVISLLHFNAADASTTYVDQIAARGWTGSGNAQIDTAQAKFGPSSLLLDGAGDFLDDGTTGDWTPFHSGLSDWTLELWLHPNAISTYHPVLCTADASANVGVVLYLDAGGIVGFDVCKGASGNYAGRIATAGGAISTGAWVHVAVDYRASRGAGEKLRLFIGGVKVGATDLVSPSSSSPYATMTIGRSINFAGYYYNGWADDFRATVGESVYDANFTPPIAAFDDA